jgi:hypothetical protein
MSSSAAGSLVSSALLTRLRPRLHDLLERSGPVLLIEASVLAAWGAVSYGFGAGGWLRDFWNYYAAGERLLASHHMYDLLPGDRDVFFPPFVSVPSLQTPIMNGLWAPLTRLPPELISVLWVSVSVLALVWVLSGIVRDGPTWGLMLVAILAFSTGGMVAVGNVNALLLAGYKVLWVNRSRPVCGAVLGVMSVTKLLPATMAGYLISQRRWRETWIALATSLVFLAAGLAVLGGAPFIEYGQLLASTAPSPMSLSGLGGVALLSPLAGVLLVLLSVRVRSPAASFRFAVLAGVLGGTALGPATLPLLIGLAIPGDPLRSEPSPRPGLVSALNDPACRRGDVKH